MNYVLVRNPKGVYKGVFEYISYSELKSPTSKQKQLLPTICDSYEIFEGQETAHDIYPKMNYGDYLYSEEKNRLELELICLKKIWTGP